MQNMLSVMHFQMLINMGVAIIMENSFLEILIQYFIYSVVFVSINIPKLQEIMDIYTALAMISPLLADFLTLFFLSA